MLNKKFLILAVLFTFISLPVMAREGNSQLSGNVYLGISGADYTYWSGSTVGLVIAGDPSLWMDPSHNRGGAGGLGFAYRYFVNESMAFTTGLAIVYKSFNVTYPANTAIDDLVLDYGTTYLLIPAGIRTYFEYFFIGGGLYYGIANDTEVEATYTTIYGTQTERKSIDFNNDLGLYVDLGFDIPLSDQVSFELGMRYERGLTTVYQKDTAIITDIKTRALLFNISLCVMI